MYHMLKSYPLSSQCNYNWILSGETWRRLPPKCQKTPSTSGLSCSHPSCCYNHIALLLYESNCKFHCYGLSPSVPIIFLCLLFFSRWSFATVWQTSLATNNDDISLRITSYSMLTTQKVVRFGNNRRVCYFKLKALLPRTSVSVRVNGSTSAGGRLTIQNDNYIVCIPDIWSLIT